VRLLRPTSGGISGSTGPRSENRPAINEAEMRPRCAPRIPADFSRDPQVVAEIPGLRLGVTLTRPLQVTWTVLQGTAGSARSCGRLARILGRACRQVFVDRYPHDIVGRAPAASRAGNRPRLGAVSRISSSPDRDRGSRVSTCRRQGAYSCCCSRSCARGGLGSQPWCSSAMICPVVPRAVAIRRSVAILHHGPGSSNTVQSPGFFRIAPACL